MTTNSNALTLPEESQFRHDVAAINKFQQIVHATLVSGQDYGVIPGTNKPTLLKPGAEKIAKLLGLADSYEIMDRQEDWVKGFFRYIIKCRLTSVSHGVVISEGMGECNSMESKYRWRWISAKDLPAGLDATKLIQQERHSKNGGHWTVFRLENDDIYSQVNTLLKMAKKRALVDAALSAGRLSEVFTQDVEDLADNGKIIDAEVDKETGEIKPAEDTGEHLCKIHNTKFFKTANMKGYAHPYDENGAKKWCNEPTEATKPTEASEKQTTDQISSPKVSAATLVDLAIAREQGVKTKSEVMMEAQMKRDWKVSKESDFTEEQALQMIKWCKGE